MKWEEEDGRDDVYNLRGFVRSIAGARVRQSGGRHENTREICVRSDNDSYRLMVIRGTCGETEQDFLVEAVMGELESFARFQSAERGYR